MEDEKGETGHLDSSFILHPYSFILHPSSCVPAEDGGRPGGVGGFLRTGAPAPSGSEVGLLDEQLLKRGAAACGSGRWESRLGQHGEVVGLFGRQHDRPVWPV